MAEKKKRGCFFYGCLTLAIVFLLGILGIFIIFRLGMNMLVKNTSASPLSFPQVEMKAEELKKTEDQVTLYQDDFKKGKRGQTLVLTDEQVNALIQNDPQMKV